MKDLGKTIAKYRKEHKLNQSQLAKELENYDIYVKRIQSVPGSLAQQLPMPDSFSPYVRFLKYMISIQILLVRVLLTHSVT